MVSMPVYIFLDESGDLGLASGGSRFFVLTGIVMERPFVLYQELDVLRYNLLEEGLDIEYFHCVDNVRRVRSMVFKLVASQLSDITAHSVVVEKAKADQLLPERDRLYSVMVGTLLRLTLNRSDVQTADRVVVITDKLPVQQQRRTTERAIKTAFSDLLPGGPPYQLLHHYSRAHYGLQIADYCCWAIFRKYETGDTSAYEMIRPAIMSELDILENVTTDKC